MTAIQANNVRVGIATDVHRFEPNRPLWLAGLHWPDEIGLLGHSDADVAVHSACDALFSACAMGDLGNHFGTSEPRWANASGEMLLRETVQRIRDAGHEPINVAVQIIGNRPRFSERREEAQGTLTAIAGCPVSLSATTTDGLGLTGRGEGMAAISTALAHVRT